VYNHLHCWILSDYTRTIISRSQEQLPPPMDDRSEMDLGMPAVLRQRHRWVSPATEKKIEKAWGPREPRQICQVCWIRCPSHHALQLHVDAHFLLHFCPCGFHDFFAYPVILHKMDCFAGESHVVDKDCFSHTARHQEGHHPSGTRRRVPDAAPHRPPMIPHDQKLTSCHHHHR